MVTAEEFRSAFARNGIVTYSESAVSLLSIAKGDAEWLIKVGLPRSAAPFLSFGGKHEISIPTVTELWGVKDCSQYRVIGSNGSGDPVAIDTVGGEIVYLNHDNGFQRVYINSRVTTLAAVLHAYQQLIAEAKAANGPDAFLDGNVPAESLNRFVTLMVNLDPPALKTGMWVEELERIQGSA